MLPHESNGRRAHVSTQSLAQGIVCFTDAASFGEHGRAAAWERLLSAAGAPAAGPTPTARPRRHRQGGADARPHHEPLGLRPLPAHPREAGGYFGDWSGNETIYASEAMSTTKLLPEVLRLIEGD